MKAFLKVLGSLLLILVLLVIAVSVWASGVTKKRLATLYQVPAADFPVPYPPRDGARPASPTSDSILLAQAVERGRHLLTARYACTECHGADFGGGVMVDAFPLGRLLAPNITGGSGSRTRDYTPADWDRIIRHGVLPDGRAAVMPSEDFQRMSDQELSDIVAFIRAHPPVDNDVPPPVYGPLGRILIATGKIIPSAARILHDLPHPPYPPAAVVDSTFGAHIAATCMGCHGANLGGGPVPGGDPKWPPARNLTPHATGLATWDYADFERAMIDGVRPDGTPLKLPMTFVMPYAKNMKPVELRALWAYLVSLEPVNKKIP